MAFDSVAQIPILPDEENRLSAISKVAIFGAGSLGREARKYLSRHGVEVLLFADNDRRKEATQLDGIRIVCPNHLPELCDCPIVIASLWAYEIAVQLRGMGFDNLFIYSSMLSNCGKYTVQPGWRPPFWFEPNIWEPSVQLAIRDLLRPGDVAFDAGVYQAGLTVLMSRLVGPGGFVCAFEASRRNLAACQQALTANGCGNTHLYHIAVAGRSGDLVPLWHASVSHSDSLFTLNPTDTGAEFDMVRTVTLDDFCRLLHFKPSLIKLDIEGAEYEAMLGMPEILSSVRPHLILEIKPDDTRAIDLLCGLGYEALDLADYLSINSSSEYRRTRQVSNILFIHHSRKSETVYRGSLSLHTISNFQQSDFVSLPDGAWLLEIARLSEAGRYVLRLDLEVLDPSAIVVVNLEIAGTVKTCHEINVLWMAGSYSDLPFETVADQTITVRINQKDAKHPAVRPRSAALEIVRGIEPGLPCWLA